MADDVAANILAVAAKLQMAAEAAVAAAQEPIFQASQGLVQVDTGRLKGSGKRHDPVTRGEVTTGTITYGNEETVTEWHGVGYEVLVHTPGTKFYGGIPYLEQPTLDAKGTFAQDMAAAWVKALS